MLDLSVFCDSFEVRIVPVGLVRSTDDLSTASLNPLVDRASQASAGIADRTCRRTRAVASLLHILMFGDTRKIGRTKIRQIVRNYAVSVPSVGMKLR
jgi:hypothetical protein